MPITKQYDKSFLKNQRPDIKGKISISTIPQKVIERYEIRVGMVTPWTNLLIVD